MSKRPTRWPAIPLKPGDALSDLVNRWRGGRDPLDRVLTYRDVVDSGLGRIAGPGGAGGPNLVPNLPGTGGIDAPTAPTGVEISAGFGHILLTWARPAYRGHSHTEVWRHDADNRANAVLNGTQGGRVYGDLSVGDGETYFYWLRHVNQNGLAGPWHALQGISATVPEDPAYLLEKLVGQIRESELHQHLSERIDLIDAPGSGLLDRVRDLADTYGDTIAAAQSAADAAQAAAEAIQAKADAIVAGNAAGVAATAADSSRVSAETARDDAAGSASAAASSASSAAGYVTDAESAASASEVHRLAAEAARDDASGSASAAASSESSAAAHKNDAESAASAAHASKLSAETAASNASTSASNAASSMTAADGSASSAAGSASEAATQAGNAGNSATAAAGSASAAESSAGVASNSASAAQAARVAAESARDAATGSASAAATSASTASTKADDAQSSAAAASQSATTADTKAGEAGTFASQAAQSATTAEGHAQASAQDYSAIYAVVGDPANPEAGTLSAMVAQSAQVVADLENDVTPVIAQWSVKSTVGALTGGVGFFNDGNRVSFGVHADQFYIASATDPAVIPFVFDDGALYLNSLIAEKITVTDAMIGSLNAAKLFALEGTIASAIIGTGDITTAMIQNANIEWARILNASVTSAQIENAAITSAKIANSIQSQTFNSSKGWRIQQSGDAEFRGVVLSRPNVVAHGTAYNEAAFNFIPPTSGDGKGGTWGTPAGWEPELITVLVDSAYDEVIDATDLYAAGFVARARVRRSTYGRVGSQPPENTNIYTTRVEAAPIVLWNHVRDGTQGGAWVSRVGLALRLYPPLNTYYVSNSRHINRVTYTEIEWSLIRLT